jgi:hypothetical protein
MLGRTLTHDKVLVENGRGGKGIVYRGVDLKLHRDEALSPKLVANPARKKKLIQQVRAAARLDPYHRGAELDP